MTVRRTINSQWPPNCKRKLSARTFEKFLLQLSLCDFDLDGLVNLLCVSALVVCVVFDGGREEGIDEGRLS
jgi:hypothetical protein